MSDASPWTSQAKQVIERYIARQRTRHKDMRPVVDHTDEGYTILVEEIATALAAATQEAARAQREADATLCAIKLIRHDHMSGQAVMECALTIRSAPLVTDA